MEASYDEEFRNAVTPPPSPPLKGNVLTEEEETKEETLASQSLIDGSAQIPISQSFQFLLEYVSNKYESKMGIGTPLDRNLFFFQEHASRRNMEKIEEYTFLFPMYVDPEQRNAVITIRPYSSIKSVQGDDIEKKCFVTHTLVPNKDAPREGLLSLHSYFQDVIRTREYEKGGLTLAHILASILACVKDNYPHFAIQKKEKDEKSLDIIWSFQIIKKKKDEDTTWEIHIYPVLYSPPIDSIHEAILSPWISHHTPVFQREIQSVKCIEITSSDVESIQSDPDVKKILDQAEEEKITK